MTASRDAHWPGAGSGTDSRAGGVHLVGSIPLESAEAVFRAVGATLARHVRRVPDGETGKRSRWNSWTAPSYERTHGLELVDPPEGSYTPWKQARLVIDASELVLERLGFADAAIASYADFARWCGSDANTSSSTPPSTACCSIRPTASCSAPAATTPTR